MIFFFRFCFAASEGKGNPRRFRFPGHSGLMRPIPRVSDQRPPKEGEGRCNAMQRATSVIIPNRTRRSLLDSGCENDSHIDGEETCDLLGMNIWTIMPYVARIRIKRSVPECATAVSSHLAENPWSLPVPRIDNARRERFDSLDANNRRLLSRRPSTRLTVESESPSQPTISHAAVSFRRGSLAVPAREPNLASRNETPIRRSTRLTAAFDDLLRKSLDLERNESFCPSPWNSRFARVK